MDSKKELWKDLQKNPAPGKRNSRMGRTPVVSFKRKRRPARRRHR